MTSSAIVLLNRASGAPLPSFPRGALGPADPFAAERELAWSIPQAAGGCVSFDGSVEIADFPHIEAIVVLAGVLTLAVDGAAALTVAAGSGVVVARGTRLRIEAAAGTRWAFYAGTAGTGLTPGVTMLSADAPLSSSEGPPAESLTGPAPQCRSYNAFSDEPSDLHAGLWDSTPYSRVSRPHRVRELMHILEGAVEMTGEDGKIVTVSAGEAVIVPQGAPLAWTSRVHVKKFYVVQDAAG